jgi:hypothetical protein
MEEKGHDVPDDLDPSKEEAQGLDFVSLGMFIIGKFPPPPPHLTGKAVK